MQRLDVKLKCEFSKATLRVKEVPTRCETSHNARGKVAATNKPIKTFCQKYTLTEPPTTQIYPYFYGFTPINTDYGN